MGRLVAYQKERPANGSHLRAGHPDRWQGEAAWAEQGDGAYWGDSVASDGRDLQKIPTPSRGARGSDREREATESQRKNANVLEEVMRRKGIDEAWTALEEMQRSSTYTDKYTISRMLMKTVGSGRNRFSSFRVYRGIALVEKFIEQQPEDVDEVLFNALLDTCCRLKDLDRLEATMNRMRDLNVKPSPVTLGILVKTYGQAGNMPKVLEIWDEMGPQREQANAVTYGCMIDACVKCGHLEKAVEIFIGMKKEGKHRNTILYTTLIKGYGLEKDLPNAMGLFREMEAEGVPYNTITYNSIIDACIKFGDIPQAEELLRQMMCPESKLEPDLITFSTLLKGYCHTGEIDKALQVAETIKARGLRCDELVYNTLMDGCVKANDIEAGVGLFEEMVNCGMQPSSITHSILMRLYQRMGYEEDAAEAVAQIYRHHGLEPPPVRERGGKSSRNRGWQNRSPAASSCNDNVAESPLASPLTGMHGGGSHLGCCGEVPFLPGYGGASESSAPSTPYIESPMATGPYLPIEALRRGMPCVPPMPTGPGADATGIAECSPVAAPEMVSSVMPQMQQFCHFPAGMTVPSGGHPVQGSDGCTLQQVFTVVQAAPSPGHMQPSCTGFFAPISAIGEDGGCGDQRPQEASYSMPPGAAGHAVGFGGGQAWMEGWSHDCHQVMGMDFCPQ